MNAAHVPARLRRRVRKRARYRCEYCLLGEQDAFFAHELDHVIAEKHGGMTTLNNLALACFDCNRFKGSDIASIDPRTKHMVPLFDPRVDFWADHFRIDGAFIRPLTDVGRATERLLKLNLAARVTIRARLVLAGRWPG